MQDILEVMKKLLPPLLVLLLAFNGCKKEQPTDPDPITSPTPTTGTTTVQQPAAQATVTAVSPSTGTSGTVVTVTGTNFGTSTTNVRVVFHGFAGTVQSVTPTEIKVVVPVTTTGDVVVSVNLQTISTGITFTYIPGPYVSGNVALATQAEVDDFAALNKGKQLQINGNLTIGRLGSKDITSVTGLSNITSVSGNIFISSTAITEASFLNTITAAGDISIYNSGFTTLSFNNLKLFSGSFTLNNLNSLTSISFNSLTTVNALYLYSCPLLTDVSFLNNLTSAGSIFFYNVGVTKITVDKLTTLTGDLTLQVITNLNSVSFKSLNNITGALYVSACLQLSNANFDNLSSVSGKLTLAGTNLADLNTFSSLQTLGSLNVEYNSALSNLQGLAHVTALSLPAIAAGSSVSTSTRLNGIYITGNSKLTSLTGLQNIQSAPVVYISDNAVLNDFCPLKAPITLCSALPVYSYTYNSTPRYPEELSKVISTSIPALTLTKNGNYATTPDALAAVALCK